MTEYRKFGTPEYDQECVEALREMATRIKRGQMQLFAFEKSVETMDEPCPKPPFYRTVPTGVEILYVKFKPKGKVCPKPPKQ